jgi:hypothetical protein
MSEIGSVDTRSRREQTLELATAAAERLEPERRRAVKGLVKERWEITADDFRDPESCRSRAQNGYPESATEAQIFRRAYGDEGGADYWRAWLFEPMPRQDFIDLLATHGAGTLAQYENLRRQLAETRLPEQCGRWDAEWLLDNPNTTHLVPASLRRWLKPVEPVEPTEAVTEAPSPSPAPLAAKNPGGAPRTVAAKVAEWYGELLPKDQKLSASKLAKSYKAQKLPGHIDHVRKKITELKETANTRPGDNSVKT